MAPSSSSSSHCSISPPPPTTTTATSHFTPILEGEEEDGNGTTSATTPSSTHKPTPTHHYSTPLHHSHKNGKQRHSKKGSNISGSSSATREEEVEDDGSVSCNKCRPSAREKISVVPLDNSNGTHHKNGSSSMSMSMSMASPNGILRSILSSFTRKSPNLPMDPYAAAREEKWKIAVAELSQKLIQATRKRDEALQEASRLKYSMAELEKKLNKLEVYCHGLKSGLEECSGNSPYQLGSNTQNRRHSFGGFHDGNKAVVEQFLVSVSEARTSVRLFNRSLTMQLRHMGGTKVHDKITALLQPYDIKLSLSKNPRSLLFYLEALLNKAFFDEFESPGFCKNSANHILNPVERCEANYASFNVLKGLTWDEVLIKGTRHFSEEFSKFCDRKMSEIVAMLGWNRAWPEPLLQAFFGASKTVWLVHLLATSVHPSLPVFRVENGVGFDPFYMEDMGGDKAKKLVPSVVRIMVAPGFYVYGNVVKCKVLCRYNSNTDSNSNSNSKGLTHSSP